MPNRVKTEDIESRITKVDYFILPGTTTTVAVIHLDNGWTSSGLSACVDPANFDKDKGEKIAYENAFDALWTPMGFALKEKLFLEGETWLDRLKNEHKHLTGKLTKLREFLSDSRSDQLSVTEKVELQMQAEVMAQYAAILQRRLDAIAAAE